MAVTCLVPGKGDVGQGDDLTVALPKFKVLKQHYCWSRLEGLPLELPPHDYLP